MQNKQNVWRLRNKLGAWLDNSREVLQSRLKLGQMTKFFVPPGPPSVFVRFRVSAEKVGKKNARSHTLTSLITHSLSATPTTLATLPAGKLGEIVRLIGRTGGASLGDIIALTGWQRHTVRAALCRLRKRGFAIIAGQHNGQTVYTLQQG